MLNSLSILIPCYNGLCTELVRSLQAQAGIIANDNGFLYEIIVGDDGSTDSDVLKKNNEINSIPNCRYIIRGFNSGRAAIRNFLAKTAKYEWLLFIDCDMEVRNPEYLANYVKMNIGTVVYGGYVINGDGKLLKNNLRYIYEKKYDGNSSAAKRARHPYNDFHTSNFIVRHEIMTAHPLDERFRKYGYEDVIWGKALHENGIAISHVDNPLSFEKFESNADFLAKTEEGLNTLHKFYNELKGYSDLIDITEKLEKLHLSQTVILIYNVTKKMIKNNLRGNKPNVFLFNIYKLGTFCRIRKSYF
ncbi:MAG: glycosyltransferase [Prevotella sp.]|nr:glycosyltransferase [Prevotella sp.]